MPVFNYDLKGIGVCDLQEHFNGLRASLRVNHAKFKKSSRWVVSTVQADIYFQDLKTN